LDCLRPLGDDQWALHVPLGKLHTERLVPVDGDVRQIVSRILTLRAQAPASQLEQSVGWLLPRWGGFWSLYLSLRYAAIQAGERAGCSQRVIPHRLRHYAASRTMPRSQSVRGSEALATRGRPRALTSTCGIVRNLDQSCFRNASSSSSG
jgi:site-specific recombinase XerC